MRRSRAASGGNRPAQPIDLDAHLARWRRCRHRPGREAGRQRHLQRGIGKTSREKRTYRGDTWLGKFSGAMPMLATMAQRLSRLQKLERTSPRLVSAYAWSCWGYSLTGLWLLYCLPSMPGTCQSTVIMPTRAFALTLVLQARRAGCAASPSAPHRFINRCVLPVSGSHPHVCAAGTVLIRERRARHVRPARPWRLHRLDVDRPRRHVVQRHKSLWHYPHVARARRGIRPARTICAVHARTPLPRHAQVRWRTGSALRCLRS